MFVDYNLKLCRPFFRSGNLTMILPSQIVETENASMALKALFCCYIAGIVASEKAGIHVDEIVVT